MSTVEDISYEIGMRYSQPGRFLIGLQRSDVPIVYRDVGITRDRKDTLHSPAIKINHPSSIPSGASNNVVPANGTLTYSA